MGYNEEVVYASHADSTNYVAKISPTLSHSVPHKLQSNLPHLPLAILWELKEELVKP